MGRKIMGCPHEVNIFHKALLGKYFNTNLTISLVSTKIIYTSVMHVPVQEDVVGGQNGKPGEYC